jgi:hypothetical protein
MGKNDQLFPIARLLIYLALGLPRLLKVPMDMPYFRIIIWTTILEKPLMGIRLLNNSSIDDVYMIYRLKAKDKFRYSYVDIEVQMLSQHSTAVHDYLEEKKKARKRFKTSPGPFPLSVAWKKNDNLGLDDAIR